MWSKSLLPIEKAEGKIIVTDREGPHAVKTETIFRGRLFQRDDIFWGANTSILTSLSKAANKHPDAGIYYYYYIGTVIA